MECVKEEEGEGEERVAAVWKEGGGQVPAYMPNLALAHHTLVCAGAKRGGEGAETTMMMMRVSMQATLMLHNAARVRQTLLGFLFVLGLGTSRILTCGYT